MSAAMDFDLSKAIQYFQTVVTKHYSDFHGRVARRDFWTYALVYLAVAVVVAIMQGLVGLGLLSLLELALLLPTAGMIARRLQDTGKNGSLVWFLMLPVLISSAVSFVAAMIFGALAVVVILFPLLWLLSLVSLIALIVLIYLCAQPGTPGSNAYGPPPAPAV